MADTRKAGDPVIDFRLTGADGKPYDLAEARRNGLVAFVFWKKGCATCQYSFPYFQRFAEQYAHPAFQFWGISQETAEDTQEFVSRYGATFPQLLDTELAVTEQYDLTSVPSIYLVDAGKTIVRHAPAFSATEYNEIARIAAERTGLPYTPIVRPEDGAPLLKPG